VISDDVTRKATIENIQNYYTARSPVPAWQ